MTVHLRIRDGSPDWYMSPDIWVVPGVDPSGAPGSPVAGQPAYLWAHVQNTGDAGALGIRVDFFWANPALQVLRSTATFLGSAYADLAPGAGQDVLCLVAWTPIMVNGGHECLVAVANHAADPLPSPLPDAFDPPSFPQVAQKNLTVLAVGSLATVHTITVGGWRRGEKRIEITADVGGALDESTLARLGLKSMRAASGEGIEVRLGGRPPSAHNEDKRGSDTLRMRVPAGTSSAVFVSIQARARLAPGEYHLVRIVERQGERTLGGIGFVIVPEART